MPTTYKVVRRPKKRRAKARNPWRTTSPINKLRWVKSSSPRARMAAYQRKKTGKGGVFSDTPNINLKHFSIADAKAAGWKPRRRKAKKAKKEEVSVSARAANPRKRKRRRSRNPGRRRPRRIRSRVKTIIIKRNRRRRNDPGRRRYNRRRRRHGIIVRRRNPGFGGALFAPFRAIFTVETATDVLAGAAGLSASLWGPKFLGHMVKPVFGRGWGGVATSLVTVGVVSGITSMVSPRAGKAALTGGLLGVFAGALSAISCGFRTQILPFETGLLACALPTVPPPQPTAEQVAQLRREAALGSMNAKSALNALGLSGYGGGNAPGVDRLLADEERFRHAHGIDGVDDFAFARRRGVSDFPNMPATSSASMDASPETF